VKNSINLDVLLNFNFFATVLAVFKRFPLISPLQYLFAPFGKITLFAQMEKATRDSVLDRIGMCAQGRLHAFFLDFSFLDVYI
jgi:hypothetical protein